MIRGQSWRCRYFSSHVIQPSSPSSATFIAVSQTAFASRRRQKELERIERFVFVLRRFVRREEIQSGSWRILRIDHSCRGVQPGTPFVTETKFTSLAERAPRLLSPAFGTTALLRLLNGSTRKNRGECTARDNVSSAVRFPICVMLPFAYCGRM